MTDKISESTTPRYRKSDLHGFLHLLEQHNDLLKIDKQVSPKFELELFHVSSIENKPYCLNM